jgi:hypothetical protein
MLISTMDERFVPLTTEQAFPIFHTIKDRVGGAEFTTLISLVTVGFVLPTSPSRYVRTYIETRSLP